MPKLNQDELAFLRAIEIGDVNIALLESEQQLTVTPEVLIAWARRAFTRGRRAQRDGFVWHDVAELVDMRNGL